jgi:hypothetical protein
MKIVGKEYEKEHFGYALTYLLFSRMIGHKKIKTEIIKDFLKDENMRGMYLMANYKANMEVMRNIVNFVEGANYQ